MRRGIIAVSGLTLATTLTLASAAWAPSTIDSRAIKIIANTCCANVSGVNTWTGTLTLNTQSGGVEQRLTEGPTNDRGDRSVTAVILRDSAGAPLAELSVDLAALAHPRGGVRTQTTVDSAVDPAPTGRANPVAAGDLRFRRDWRSEILDPTGRTVVVNEALLDVRFRRLKDGVQVQQRIDVSSAFFLSIEFSVFDGPALLASATVTLATEQRAEPPSGATAPTGRDSE